ncbi:MAG: metalloregulator ArsR/SmtB family transcription factor [Gammaproteobacteria bacterium]|nr:metalloregulator ArsR/SmtB family transcription factor [Gammaproteobacteria bacterium]
MKILLNALRAAGESTRLRLLTVLARSELTVTELTRILSQSQPRVSRHLKLLTEANLVDRYQEGAWVFYRISDGGPAERIVSAILDLIPTDDSTIERDLERLELIKQEHVAEAAVYFKENAKQWDRIRRLYVAESQVEKALLNAVDDMEIENLLDLGTGTGRIMEIFSSRIERGLGIDMSREMLTVARANLESVGISHCQVRQGDILNLSAHAKSMDVVTIHHVLHFLDNPADAVTEAARVLKPGGRLLIADFAPHNLEYLRNDYAHRRLGFPDDEVNNWLEAAGLQPLRANHLASRGKKDTDRLTVSVWSACRPGEVTQLKQKEVA